MIVMKVFEAKYYNQTHMFEKLAITETGIPIRIGMMCVVICI